MKNYFEEETPEEFDQRMEWWRDARFGMFIHWGLYAVPAGIRNGKEVEGIGEWIMDHDSIPISEYEKYTAEFNPVKYNAEEWVKIAKNAGMKYIVITSKHHDGFGLWDSKVSDYDIMDASPYKKDILKALADACKKEGIKLCFYHSIMDWHHPDAQAPHYPDYNTDKKKNPNFDKYRTEYMKPQLKELITNYDPEVLWFDGEWIPEWTHEHGLDLYQFCRELKPNIIVNNRVDKGRKGMQGMNESDQKYAGDFGTPEQEILDGTSEFDWESCMTMNDTWGFKKNDNNWKSAENLIQNLVDIAAKGGNYLLNVGPTAEGIIPVPSQERLAEIGDWMKVNSEVIYATRGTKNFKEGEKIRYIQSKDGKTQYVANFGWPGQQFECSGLQPKEGNKIFMLGYEKPLEWEAKEGKVSIKLPAELQNESKRPCKYVYVFKVQA
ncbi:MAG: alpha-L-fucosidase [Microscillaceae bacterium]|nr:alpha-L-fucosidase [Microscillaceae bacterium]